MPDPVEPGLHSAGRRTAVFAGPSLYGHRLPDALRDAIRPPVREGDLGALPGIADGVWDIVVIDGEFGQSRAVTITEIRHALRAGNRVLGASSMGALRATECAPIGMRGSGWIYDAYASGKIESDEEVALLYDPESYEPVTVPTVNIRWLTLKLLSERLITAEDEHQALRVARELFFRKRTPDALRRALAACLTDHPGLAHVVDALAEEQLPAWDRKRLDALEVIKKHEATGEFPGLGNPVKPEGLVA
ncbi:TfuA-like protein [Streptomyces bauhiniae]